VRKTAVRNRIAQITAVLLLWWPEAAAACAVCFSGQGADEARGAFRITTVVLTFLPLVAIGGAAWWLRRRARELDREHGAEAAPAAIDPANATF